MLLLVACSHGPAVITFRADAACALTIDGSSAGIVEPGAPVLMELSLGGHFVSCRSEEGGIPWEYLVEIKSSRAKTVPILLSAKVLAKRRDKAAKAAAARAMAFSTPGSPHPARNAPVEFVLVPAGSFDMGCVSGDRDCRSDETPRHRVELSAFLLAKTPVTIAAFDQFVQATGYKTVAERDGSGDAIDAGPGHPWGKKAGATWRSTGFQQGKAHPVVDVTWDDASAFCEWAGGRLPTEAEWEYAARAGQEGRKYAWGDVPTPLANGENLANVADESATRGVLAGYTIVKNYDDGFTYTSPVAAFPANAFGLHDMEGNVFEWCADWYGARYYATSARRDPKGPQGGDYRVVRGSSWLNDSPALRTSGRLGVPPDGRSVARGFRCARDPRS